jgi:SpoVK/Ycf46/Vps4 family AAA+-type ATPase
MLAKAVATEGGATFLTVDTSTIENKWLGESEKNARAVFTLARKLAPCVVYLDEVDSILASREHGDDSSHRALTSVKTTLMQEWDGLRTTKDRVVVIASTNRPFDLDEAVLRRLPRRILVDLPDAATRTEILKVTLAGNRIAADVDLAVLAERFPALTSTTTTSTTTFLTLCSPFPAVWTATRARTLRRSVGRRWCESLTSAHSRSSLARSPPTAVPPPPPRLLLLRSLPMAARCWT